MKNFNKKEILVNINKEAAIIFMDSIRIRMHMNRHKNVVKLVMNNKDIKHQKITKISDKTISSLGMVNAINPNKSINNIIFKTLINSKLY